ncbi:hypothetical protein [Halalkalibacillus halophilus]|uniref:hypothetical protein n=1 Tax=Halalkalibacillus halophilus TaxID=392827 RepID=UPI00042158ED|nr:hypothetical protein [Halalkalibacillus halophilus]
MIGLLVSDDEKMELDYLLRREMDELIYDFHNHHYDSHVKEAIKVRYQLLFNLYKRFADRTDCIRYTPNQNLLSVK